MLDDHVVVDLHDAEVRHAVHPGKPARIDPVVTARKSVTMSRPPPFWKTKVSSPEPPESRSSPAPPLSTSLPAPP